MTNGGRWSFSVTRGFVHVRMEDIPDVAAARRLCDEIDGRLGAANVRAVLVDSRDLVVPPEEARQAMWAWGKRAAHHERCAIVVRSPLKQVTGNMTAVSLGAKVRSFPDLESAMEWLRPRA